MPGEVSRPFRVALVNNMPDAAFVDTEEQFRAVLGDRVTLELYTFTEMPRGELAEAAIAARYEGLDALWHDPPDALVVTGTEPAQAQLAYEPYWPYLARLLEWAAAEVPTTMLSCLAAHASILLFDGIERSPLPVKLSGVYEAAVTAPEHPLARGLPARVPVPHSRINDVPEAALREAGYEIILGSGPGAGGPGWSVATRRRDRGLFVLCQGHPEYSGVSLLREFRRDARRSVFGRGMIAYPEPPVGYFEPAGLAALGAFGQRARAAAPVAAGAGVAAGTAPGAGTSADTDALQALWATFPYDEVAAGIVPRWTPSSRALYDNWLELAGAPAGGG